jgi:hypothetical protein
MDEAAREGSAAKPEHAPRRLRSEGDAPAEDAFVRTIAGGRHAVWLPDDDSRGAFAHSIGLAYLHDLPEILLLSPMPAMIGASVAGVALTVNAIADAMIGGIRLKPGDRYAVVAGTVARTVHKESTLDQAGLAQSCFVVPSPRIQERTLGAANWFYANFMDTTSFPVLACLLQPPRIPDGYGVPPPPPPRIEAAVAKAAAPARREARAAEGESEACARQKADGEEARQEGADEIRHGASAAQVTLRSR